MASTLPKRSILLDQNAPKRLDRELSDYVIHTAFEMGWSRLSDGDLIAAAEQAHFDILLTADRNLRYQQNISGRALAIVVLESNRWTIVEDNLDLVIAAIGNAAPGKFTELTFRPRSSGRKP